MFALGNFIPAKIEELAISSSSFIVTSFVFNTLSIGHSLDGQSDDSQEQDLDRNIRIAFRNSLFAACFSIDCLRFDFSLRSSIGCISRMDT
jgi:hypothetical protein